jgi:hypothetical protein
MREGRELDTTGRVAAVSAEERSERRRPQVEVIREPNEIDEGEAADPAAK